MPASTDGSLHLLSQKMKNSLKNELSGRVGQAGRLGRSRWRRALTRAASSPRWGGADPVPSDQRSGCEPDLGESRLLLAVRASG